MAIKARNKKSATEQNTWRFIQRSDTPKSVLRTVEIMLRCLNLPVSAKKGLSFSALTCFFIATNTIVMQCAHVTYMISYITDVEKMANTCSTVSTTFQGIVKLISLYKNSSNIREICTINYKYFWPTSVASKTLQSQLNKLASWSRVLMLSFYVLIFFCCSLLLIPPLFLGIRELPLASIYPFQWQKSPLYEGMYVWQWIVSLFGVCYVVGSHDFLFVTAMINLIVQFRLLQYVLRKIGTEEENQFYSNVSQYHFTVSNTKDCKYNKENKLFTICVVHHIRLLQYGDIVEKTFSTVVFSQFVESVSGLCLGVFLLNVVDGVNFLKLVFFVIGHLAQLLLYCIAGNEVMYQSVLVADAAFDCDWHKNCNRRLINGLIMLIRRAQRSKKITALGMADLNIQSFIEVLRSSISFSTLFKTMIEKQNTKN